MSTLPTYDCKLSNRMHSWPSLCLPEDSNLHDYTKHEQETHKVTDDVYSYLHNVKWDTDNLFDQNRNRMFTEFDEKYHCDDSDDCEYMNDDYDDESSSNNSDGPDNVESDNEVVNSDDNNNNTNTAHVAEVTHEERVHELYTPKEHQNKKSCCKRRDECLLLRHVKYLPKQYVQNVQEHDLPILEELVHKLLRMGSPESAKQKVANYLVNLDNNINITINNSCNSNNNSNVKCSFVRIGELPFGCPVEPSEENTSLTWPEIMMELGSRCFQLYEFITSSHEPGLVAYHIPRRLRRLIVPFLYKWWTCWEVITYSGQIWRNVAKCWRLHATRPRYNYHTCQEEAQLEEEEEEESETDEDANTDCSKDNNDYVEESSKDENGNQLHSEEEEEKETKEQEKDDYESDHSCSHTSSTSESSSTVSSTTNTTTSMINTDNSSDSGSSGDDDDNDVNYDESWVSNDDVSEYSSNNKKSKKLQHIKYNNGKREIHLSYKPLLELIVNLFNNDPYHNKFVSMLESVQSYIRQELRRSTLAASHYFVSGGTNYYVNYIELLTQLWDWAAPLLSERQIKNSLNTLVIFNALLPACAFNPPRLQKKMNRLNNECVEGEQDDTKKYKDESYKFENFTKVKRRSIMDIENKWRRKVETNKKELRTLVHKVVSFILLEGLTWSGNSSQGQITLNWQSNCFQVLAKFINPNCYGLFDDMDRYAEPLLAAMESYLQLNSLRSMQMDNLQQTQKRTAEDREMEMQQQRRVCDVNATEVFLNEYSTEPNSRFHFTSLNRNAVDRLVASIVLCSLPKQTNSSMWNHLRRFIHAMNDIPLQSMSKTRKSMSNSGGVLNHMISKHGLFPSSNKMFHDAVACYNNSGGGGEAQRIIIFYTNLIDCFYVRVMKARRRATKNENRKELELCSCYEEINYSEYAWNDNGIVHSFVEVMREPLHTMELVKAEEFCMCLRWLLLLCFPEQHTLPHSSNYDTNNTKRDSSIISASLAEKDKMNGVQEKAGSGDEEMTERLMNEFVMPQLAHLVGHVPFNINITTNKNVNNIYKESTRDIILSANDRAFVLLLLTSCAPLLLESPMTRKTFRAFFMEHILPIITGVDWMNNSNAWKFNYCIMYVIFVTHTALEATTPFANQTDHVIVKKEQQQKAKCNTTSKVVNTDVASSSSPAIDDSDDFDFSNNKEDVITSLDCTINDNKQQHVEKEVENVNKVLVEEVSSLQHYYQEQNKYNEFISSFFERSLELLRHKSGSSERNEVEMYVSSAVMLGEIFYSICSDKIAWHIAQFVIHTLHHMSIAPSVFDLYLITALTRRFPIMATQYVHYTISLLAPCGLLQCDTECIMEKSLPINSQKYKELEEEEEEEQLQNYQSTNVKERKEEELEEEEEFSSRSNQQGTKTHDDSVIMEIEKRGDSSEQKEKENYADIVEIYKFHFSFTITDAKELHHSCLLLSTLLPSLRLSELYALRASITSCIYMLCRHLEYKENVESAILLYKSFYLSLLHQLHMESCTLKLREDNTNKHQKTQTQKDNNNSNNNNNNNVKENNHTYEITRAESQYTNCNRVKRYRECDFKIEFNNSVFMNERCVKITEHNQNVITKSTNNNKSNICTDITTENVMQGEHVVNTSSEHINNVAQGVHVFLNAFFTALLIDLIDLLHTLHMHSTHANKPHSSKKTSFSALQSLCEKICTSASLSSSCEQKEVIEEVNNFREEHQTESDNNVDHQVHYGNENNNINNSTMPKFLSSGVINSIYGSEHYLDSIMLGECIIDDNVITNIMQLLCSILVISRDQFYGVELNLLENAQEHCLPKSEDDKSNNYNVNSNKEKSNNTSIISSNAKCVKTHSLSFAPCPWYFSTERYCYNSFNDYCNDNSEITLPFSREDLLDIIFTEALPLLLDYNHLLATTTHHLQLMNKFIDTNNVFESNMTHFMNERTTLQSRNIETHSSATNNINNNNNSNHKNNTSPNNDKDSNHIEEEQEKEEESHKEDKVTHKCVYKGRSTELEINLQGLEWAVEILQFLASPMHSVDLTKRQEYFNLRKNLSSSPSSTISTLFDDDNHRSVHHYHNHHNHHQERHLHDDNNDKQKDHCDNNKKTKEENNENDNNNDKHNLNIHSQSFQSLIWFAHNLLDDNSVARPFRYHANRLYYLNETFAERRCILEKYRRYPLRFWCNKLSALWQRSVFTMHSADMSLLRPLSIQAQSKLTNLALMLIPTYLASINHSKQINSCTSGYSNTMRYIQRNSAFVHMLLSQLFQSMCIEHLDSELQLILLNSLTQIVLSKLSYVQSNVNKNNRNVNIDDNDDDNDNIAKSHENSASSSQSRTINSETAEGKTNLYEQLQEMEEKESMTRAQLNFIRCSVKSELLMIKTLVHNISLCKHSLYAPQLPIYSNCNNNNNKPEPNEHTVECNDEIIKSETNDTKAQSKTTTRTKTHNNYEDKCYAINVMQSVIIMIRSWPEELHDEATKELLYVALPEAMASMLITLPIHLLEAKVEWLHCFIELAYDCYKSTPTLATSWLSLATEVVDEICAQVSLKESLESSCMETSCSSCEEQEEEELEETKKQPHHHCQEKGQTQESIKETFLPLSVKAYKHIFKMTLEPNIGIQQTALQLTSRLMCATRPSMNCTPSHASKTLSSYSSSNSHVNSQTQSKVHEMMNNSTSNNTEPCRVFLLQLRKNELLQEEEELQECLTSNHNVNMVREVEHLEEQQNEEKQSKNASDQKKKKNHEGNEIKCKVDMPCHWWEKLRCVRYAHLHTLINTIKDKFPLHVDRIQRAGDVFLPKYFVLYGNNSFYAELTELLNEFNNNNNKQRCKNNWHNDTSITINNNNNNIDDNVDEYKLQNVASQEKEFTVSLIEANDAKDAIATHRLKEENIFMLVTQENYEQRMKECYENNKYYKSELEIQECEYYENSLDVRQDCNISSEHASLTEPVEGEEQQQEHHHTEEKHISYNNNNNNSNDCSTAIDELTTFIWQGAFDKTTTISPFTSFDWIGKFILSLREFIKTVQFPPEYEAQTNVTKAAIEVQLIGTRWWMYLSNVIWPEVYQKLLHKLITMWVEQVEGNCTLFDKIQVSHEENNNTTLLETSDSTKEEENATMTTTAIDTTLKKVLENLFNVDEVSDIRNEERVVLVMQMIMGYAQSPLLNLPSTLLTERHQERLHHFYKPLLTQCLCNKVQYKASSVVMMWLRFGVARSYFAFTKFDMIYLMREICTEIDLYLHFDRSSSSFPFTPTSEHQLEQFTPSQTELSTLVRLMQLLAQVLTTFAHEMANDKEWIQEWVSTLMKWEDVLMFYSFYSVRISTLMMKLMSKTLELATEETLIYNAINTQINTINNNGDDISATRSENTEKENNEINTNEEHERKLEGKRSEDSALDVLITFAIHLHDRWANTMNKLMSLLAKQQSSKQVLEITNNEFNDNHVVVNINDADDERTDNSLDEATDKSKKTTIKLTEETIGRYMCELRVLILLWSSVSSPILFRCFRERLLSQLVKTAHIMSVYKLKSTSELTIAVTSTILSICEVIITKEDVHELLMYITSLFVNENTASTEAKTPLSDLHTLQEIDEESRNGSVNVNTNNSSNSNTDNENNKECVNIKDIPCGLQAMFIHLLRQVLAKHYHKIGKFAHMELIWRTARSAFANYFDTHAHGTQHINAHRANAYKLKVQALALVITLTRVASSSQINVLVQRELKQLSLHALQSVTNNINSELITRHIANFHVLCAIIASDTCGSIPSYLPKLMERLIREVQNNHIQGVQEREQRRNALHTASTEEINEQTSSSISPSTVWLEEKATLTEILTRWWNQFHRDEWENEYRRYFTPAQAEHLLLFVRGHCKYYA